VFGVTLMLSPPKLQAVRSLVETVPDATITGLSRALANTPPGGVMGPVRALVNAEAEERAVRNTVLAPITGLCRGGRRVGRMTFPSRVLRGLWSGLKADSPRLVAEARMVWPTIDPESYSPPVLDKLCAIASAGLRAREQSDFSAAADACDATLSAGAEAMAGCLDLAPIVRSALPHLEDWMRRMDDDHQTQARLVFNDAVALAPDAGPKLVEMLSSRLDEPWLALKLISAVMDRPTEAYLADSEMAGIAVDVFDDIQEQLNIINAFDPRRDGGAAARKAGRAVHEATLAIADFEDCVELSREGLMGKQLSQQKMAMARMVEAKLDGVDAFVAAALPLETIRFAGRMTKAVPKLTDAPDPELARRAEAALLFVRDVRSAANTGGFAAARAKALAKVNDRLASYTEDLLTHLRTEDAAVHERTRSFIEVAANLVGLATDESAAQIVRRRAAA